MAFRWSGESEGFPRLPTEPGEAPIEELLRLEEQFNDLVGIPNPLSDAEVKPGEKPASPEMVWQFEMDGTITMGVFSNGEIEFFEGQKMPYKVDGLDVVGFEDGKEDGGMTFSSAKPKKGDKVLMGEKGQEKISVTITRIQDASSPPPVSKTPSQPPVSPAKPNPVEPTP